MNIHTFFNTALPFYGHTESLVKIGNLCLAPVRYLFNGHQIVFFDENKLYHYNVYQKNWSKTAAAILLLAPSLILGTFIKGLGYYISKDQRAIHRIINKHYTPMDPTQIGAEQERRDLTKIKESLQDIQIHNLHNQPTVALTIYANEGTEITEDPGILALGPQKLILIGASLKNDGTPDCLVNKLKLYWRWEKNVAGDSTAKHYIVKSVEEAMQDVPPRISMFSTERYKRIYVVKH